MATTISLSAGADYGQSGQYVARITGRDPKVTFAREFVGRKAGKRRDRTEHDTDEPGLYVEVDATKRGKVERYYVVYSLPDEGLVGLKVSRDEAMALARRLDDERSVDWTRAAVECRLRVAEARDPEEEVEISHALPGLPAGKAKRGEMVAALRRLLGPPEGDGKAEAIARVRALMAELGVTAEDLE